MRQPESEAPALPTEHPEAVTSSRTGRMDSLNLICPSGDWDKNRKANTWCSSVGYLNHKSDWMYAEVHLICPNSSIWEYVCMQLTQGQVLGSSGDISSGFGHFGSLACSLDCA